MIKTFSASNHQLLNSNLCSLAGAEPETVLPFPYCNPISTWWWKVFSRPLTNKSLFSRPWMMCAMTSQEETNVRSVFAIPEDFLQDV